MVFKKKKKQKKQSHKREIQKVSINRRSPERKRQKTSKISGKKRSGQVLLTLFLWSFLIFFSGFVWLWYDLPDLNKLTVATRRPYIEILDINKRPLRSYGDKHLTPVILKNIPLFIPKAVMAIEDHRFHDHRGIDFLGLGRALVTNIMSGKIKQGGSTLTQQLAKTLFLSPKRSIKRKLQELIVSFWLERHFSKDQILTIYLNRVYMGPGLYGFSAAAQHYFGKNLRHVTLWEAAGLAGMLKAPQTYSPLYKLDYFKERATLVISRMENLDYITKAQEKRARKNLLAYKIKSKETAGASELYFTDWIYRQIFKHIPFVNQDLIITTTYSPSAQKSLEAAVDVFDKKRNLKEAQLAMIVMGTGGSVQGMIGGRKYFLSSFNRAFQAKRQTGSVFKLFVYMAGLIKGMNLTDKIKDTPVRLGNWRPKNYAWKSQGQLKMSEALAYSVNTVTVRIAKKIGVVAFLKVAKKMGALRSIPKKPNLTMSLGTLESSLLAMTSSFATVANGCMLVNPYGITKIETPKGKMLYSRKKKKERAIASKKVCKDMTTMLIKAVNYGTAKQAYRKGHIASAKTGTTQDHRDAWFIGFENPYVVGVWIGNDNNAPLPNKMTGGRLPAQLWKLVMSFLKK